MGPWDKLVEWTVEIQLNSVVLCRFFSYGGKGLRLKRHSIRPKQMIISNIMPLFFLNPHGFVDINSKY